MELAFSRKRRLGSARAREQSQHRRGGCMDFGEGTLQNTPDPQAGDMPGDE